MCGQKWNFKIDVMGRVDNLWSLHSTVNAKDIAHMQSFQLSVSESHDEQTDREHFLWQWTEVEK